MLALKLLIKLICQILQFRIETGIIIIDHIITNNTKPKIILVKIFFHLINNSNHFGFGNMF